MLISTTRITASSFFRGYSFFFILDCLINFHVFDSSEIDHDTSFNLGIEFQVGYILSCLIIRFVTRNERK